MRLPGTRDTLLAGLAGVALIAVPALAKEAPAPPPNGLQSDFPMVVGKPYQIGGVTFVPSDSMNFDSVGYASVGSEGGGAIDAAHHTLPVPSYAEVTDLATGRTILVRIARRGPMDGDHAIELSPGAASQLGIATNGKAAVRVRRVNPPEAERALLRAGEPAPERMATPRPLLDVLQRKLNPALAQRTLDAADEDAGPARVAPATMAAKPVIATPQPASTKVPAKATPVKVAFPAAPTVKPVVADGPPKGYVPSVPAPSAKVAGDKVAKGKPPHGAKAGAAMPATGASFAGGAEVSTTPQVSKPQPAAKPETPAKSAAKPAPPAPAEAGKFTVQAGAFSDKARAQTVADKIGGTLSQTGKVWRVRVGPYAGHASAEAALAKVKSAGYSDARIQRAE